MKQLLIFILILTVGTAAAQPNVETGFNNKGGRIGAGYVQESTGIAISFTHNFPIIRYDIPNTSMLQVGYEHQAGDFTVTALAGAAYNAWTQTAKMDPDLQVRDNFKAAGSLEAGWNKHIGQVFIYGAYAGTLYVGAGMKIKFK